MITMTAIVDSVKEEFTVKSLKDRLSSKTISDVWRKTRDIALIVYIVGSAVISPVCPFAIPTTVIAVAGWVTYIAGAIAGVAQLDKSKRK